MPESEADLAFMDEVLHKLMADDPNFNPDDLTPEMLVSLMGIPGFTQELPGDKDEDELQMQENSEEDFYQKIVDKRTAEEKEARGKAEVTSAAIDVLTARNVVDELSLQIASVEQQFADIDAKFMESLTFLMGGGFKQPERFEHQVQVATAEEAATHMIGRKRIAILTGAGISVASGIPTFRM